MDRDILQKRVVERLEGLWRERDHRQEEFASLARDVLADAHLHRDFQVERIPDCLPANPITELHPSPVVLKLHTTERFYVALHFWGSMIGTAHHHSWSGAFQILQSSSVLHAVYGYEEAERVHAGLRLGTLKLLKLEALRSGDCVEVHPGDRYIHGLWHVKRPSISISIRDTLEAGELPLDYSYPGVARQIPERSVEAQRLVRMISILSWVSVKTYGDTLESLVSQTDISSLYSLFSHVIGRLEDTFWLDKLPELLKKRDRADLAHRMLVPFLKDLRRSALFEQVRERIEDEDVRLFLGALYFAEDLEGVLGLMRREHPSTDIHALIAGHLETVMRAVNKRAIPPQLSPESARIVFRAVAEGASCDDCLRRLAREGTAPSEAVADGARALHVELTGCPLFDALGDRRGQGF